LLQASNLDPPIGSNADDDLQLAVEFELPQVLNHFFRRLASEWKLQIEAT